MLLLDEMMQLVHNMTNCVLLTRHLLYPKHLLYRIMILQSRNQFSLLVQALLHTHILRQFEIKSMFEFPPIIHNVNRRHPLHQIILNIDEQFIKDIADE